MVKKSALLESIRRNRDAHKSEYDAAMAIYREKMIELLELRLVEIQDGGPIERHIALPEPRSFLDSYDTAIAMLEWHTADEVPLAQHDFERYVLNNWEWKTAFAAQTQGYTVS